jgi:drug/metabolite transporter (DMT)-like permease
MTAPIKPASILPTLPALAALTMVAFAANSLLARIAMAGWALDPASFTFLRLASGAVVLAFLVTRRRGMKIAVTSGSWASALSLLVYAGGFSFAYVSLDSGTGALILFAFVQITMIGAALLRGNRPTSLEWAGLAIALGGLGYLLAPGTTAPHLPGALLMAAAGIGWGIYTLRGAGDEESLIATAGNFIRATPVAALVLAVGWTSGSVLFSPIISPIGVIAAVVSGAITSALGYALWYKVLEVLPTTRAAIIQLTVPAIAALGGVTLLHEELTLRLLIACPIILGGVALALLGKPKRA